MARFFNTTGPCNPQYHYTLPSAPRLPTVRGLIDQGLCFTVHAPRQTGKTTAFLELAGQLTAAGHHAALLASCEGGQTAGADIRAAVLAIVRSIEERAELYLPPELRPPPLREELEPESLLRRFLLRWARQVPRPLVLFLDEIDALQDDSLISVLRQLRDGFSLRPAAFPSSVALIGLRDVRDYRVRDQVWPARATLGTASPFNVKADSLTLPMFTPDEVATLLAQHTAETGQPFTPAAVAELYEQSQGQPWLVNALAGLCTTRPDALVPDRNRAVTVEHLRQARELLIERRDTHLDSLAERLREPRVRRVLEPILAGSPFFDPSFDDDFAWVRDLGLVVRQQGALRIANPIYQEIIPRILASHVQAGISLEPAWYLAPDGTLDLARLIAGFLEFWRENGEVLLRGMLYQEAAPHLVFMAYLQRVVNGGGRITREFAVGTRRADLVVELGGRRDVLELKLATSPHALAHGLTQVAAYARRLGRDRGYLILFDPRATTPWEARGQVTEVAQEEITVVVVCA